MQDLYNTYYAIKYILYNKQIKTQHNIIHYCRMSLFEHTLYINLTDRVDRLVYVTNQLKKVNIANPQRFPAIKMKSGAIGCTLSHLKCLELAKKNGWPHVFICEDDITFTQPELFLESMKKFEDDFTSKSSSWDVLIIGGNNCPPYNRICDNYIRIFNCQTTTGYIVNAQYYDTLIQNFKEGVAKLMKDLNNKREYAIDMYWKSLQQTDNWFMIIPLTVTQCDGFSDIEQRDVNYSHLMLDLDKEWFIRRQAPKMHNMLFSLKH